eukprot:6457483-Prymnesium_polylepis.1
MEEAKQKMTCPIDEFTGEWMERLERKKSRKLDKTILAADLVATLRELRFAVTSEEHLMANYVTTTEEGLQEFAKEQYGDKRHRIDYEVTPEILVVFELEPWQ